MSEQETKTENKEIQENKIEGVSPKTISQLSKEKEIAIGEIEEEFNDDFSSWISEKMLEDIINKKENRSK